MKRRYNLSQKPIANPKVPRFKIPEYAITMQILHFSLKRLPTPEY
jgi:hypothetical protein